MIEKLREVLRWEDSSGDDHLISDMATPYILNAVNKLKKYPTYKDNSEYWIDIFTKELEYRNSKLKTSYAYVLDYEMGKVSIVTYPPGISHTEIMARYDDKRFSVLITHHLNIETATYNGNGEH